jgi:hypothetical protein
METVSSGDFIHHDVSRDSNECWVTDMLVHTDQGQDKPVIIIADRGNNELRTFDKDREQCVSQCTTPSPPMCMYELDGSSYLHCQGGSLHRIVVWAVVYFAFYFATVGQTMIFV